MDNHRTRAITHVSDRECEYRIETYVEMRLKLFEKILVRSFPRNHRFSKINSFQQQRIIFFFLKVSPVMVCSRFTAVFTFLLFLYRKKYVLVRELLVYCVYRMCRYVCFACVNCSLKMTIKEKYINTNERIHIYANINVSMLAVIHCCSTSFSFLITPVIIII
jgi:hypothetical protein